MEADADAKKAKPRQECRVPAKMRVSSSTTPYNTERMDGECAETMTARGYEQMEQSRPGPGEESGR
jgi:hypothetical protein